MTITRTYDTDGNVVSEEVKPQTFTISVGRKVGLPNYSNKELSLFGQVDVTEDDTPESIQQKVRQQREFLKGLVLEGLGIPYDIDADGNVVERNAPPAPASQQPASSSAPPRRSNGGSKPAARKGQRPSPEVIEAQWTYWNEHPEDFYDNRPKKADGTYKAGASDFAGKKGTGAEGMSLWIDSAPAWVSLAIGG
jgi:hypothetical protein